MKGNARAKAKAHNRQNTGSHLERRIFTSRLMKACTRRLSSALLVFRMKRTSHLAPDLEPSDQPKFKEFTKVSLFLLRDPEI